MDSAPRNACPWKPNGEGATKRTEVGATAVAGSEDDAKAIQAKYSEHVKARWEDLEAVDDAELGEKLRACFEESWESCVQGWSTLESLYRIGRTLLPEPRDTEPPKELEKDDKEYFEPGVLQTCLASEASKWLNASYLDLNVYSLQQVLLPPSAGQKIYKGQISPHADHGKQRLFKHESTFDHLVRPTAKILAKVIEFDRMQLEKRLESLSKKSKDAGASQSRRRGQGRAWTLGAILSRGSNMREAQDSRDTVMSEIMLLKSVRRLYTAWARWEQHFKELEETTVLCGDLSQTIRLLKSSWSATQDPLTGFPERNIELMCRTHHEIIDLSPPDNLIPNLLGGAKQLAEAPNLPTLAVFEKYKGQADSLRTLKDLLMLCAELLRSEKTGPKTPRDILFDFCFVVARELSKFEQDLRFPSNSGYSETTRNTLRKLCEKANKRSEKTGNVVEMLRNAEGDPSIKKFCRDYAKNVLNMVRKKGKSLCRILKAILANGGNADAMQQSRPSHFAVIDWLRSMDEEEFQRADEEAQSKEQKDCPDELWDPVQGLDGNINKLDELRRDVKPLIRPTEFKGKVSPNGFTIGKHVAMPSLETYPDHVIFEDWTELLHALDLIDEDGKERDVEPITNPEVGMEVDCRRKEDDEINSEVWYPGKIKKVYTEFKADGVQSKVLVDIEYADGEEEDRVEKDRLARQQQDTIDDEAIVSRYKYIRRFYKQFQMVMDPDSDKGDLQMLENWLKPEREAHWVIDSRRVSQSKSALFLVHKHQQLEAEGGDKKRDSAVGASGRQDPWTMVQELLMSKGGDTKDDSAASALGRQFEWFLTYSDEKRPPPPPPRPSDDKDKEGGNMMIESQGTDKINYPMSWSGQAYKEWSKTHRDYDQETLEDMRSGLNLCNPKEEHEKINIQNASMQFQHMLDLADTYEKLQRSGHFDYREYQFGMRPPSGGEVYSKKEDRKLLRDDKTDQAHRLLTQIYEAAQNDRTLEAEQIPPSDRQVFRPPPPATALLSAFSSAVVKLGGEVAQQKETWSHRFEAFKTKFRAECKANGSTVIQEFYAQQPDELGKEVEQKKQELRKWADDVSECKRKHYFLNFLSLCQVHLDHLVVLFVFVLIRCFLPLASAAGCLGAHAREARVG